ncbi:hypothetical protein PT974_03566 [Cladobotryum mycophilum]|uniref:Fucose-specific lectin n=1 Tax=Cladobotryum mycophilum TaxID=491253 RepID=A0ABR0SSN5_9HYPO
MALTPQYVAQYLNAAAGAIPLDQTGLYLVAEEDDTLFEQFWTETELADQVYIASGVKEGTPVLYLLSKDERGVFYLDTENTLQYSTYDAEEEEWEETAFKGDGQITTHSSSRLSGTFFEGGKLVFFEAPSGQFQSVHFLDDGTSKLLPPLPVSDDNALHLIYIHQDGHLHHLTRGSEATEWQDNVLPGTQFNNSKITKFVAVPTSSSTFQIGVLTAEGKLTWVDEQGTRDEIGTIKEGRLIPKSSEENTRAMMRLMEGAVNSATGSQKR